MKLYVASLNADGRSYVESVTEGNEPLNNLWNGDVADIHEVIARVDPANINGDIAEPVPRGFRWNWRIKPPDADAAPGEGSHPAMHTTRTIDFDFCALGQMQCILDTEVVDLVAGDAIILKAAHHRWWNPGPETALMLTFLHNPGPPEPHGQPSDA